MRTTVHFSSIQTEIIKELRKATVEIKAAIAWMTDEDIIRVLSQQAEAGLNVQIVISDSIENFRNTKKFKDFLRNGGKLHIAAPKFLHNKFCIIDRKTIINGSYNWTYYAHKNEENILTISLDPAIEEDCRMLMAFEAKHKFFCEKTSKIITDIAELVPYREQGKEVSTILARYDEEEINLRQELEDDVKNSFEIAKSLGIGVSSFLLERMKIDGGGVELIKRILHEESNSKMKSGFNKLAEPIPHRVDLSLEYLASRPKYQRLFTQKEINFCTQLMAKYGL